MAVAAIRRMISPAIRRSRLRPRSLLGSTGGLESMCNLHGHRCASSESDPVDTTNGGSGSPSRRPRAALVNGRRMAAEILCEVRNEVRLMKKKYGYAPGLAVILVGSRRDSAKYVAMKDAVAKTAGLVSFSVALPDDATHHDVLKVIDEFNHNDRCHGILLQLPLPAHLDPRGLLGAIKLEKDVECFHPMNTGRLSAWRRTVVAPCTPRGVMEMLSRLHIPVKGCHAVVLGESSVVGLPMALMLNAARATVTIVHAHTVDPKRYVRQADLVIAAVGVPELVKRDWLKPGAVVIDVGINFVKDESRREGFRIVGDVAPCVRDVASVVSPVPGGVGPMTVVMLMRNCVDMALLKTKWSGVTDWIQHEQAAENARRMQGAVLDLALGRDRRTASLENSGDDTVSDPNTAEDDDLAEKRAAEMRRMMERVGDEVDEAELLTIISDTERNAYSLLSFFEFSSAHSHSHDPTDQVTVSEQRQRERREKGELPASEAPDVVASSEKLRSELRAMGTLGAAGVAPTGEFHWSKGWGLPSSGSEKDASSTTSSQSSTRREGEEKRLHMLESFRKEAAAKFGDSSAASSSQSSRASTSGSSSSHGHDEQYLREENEEDEWWLLQDARSGTFGNDDADIAGKGSKRDDVGDSQKSMESTTEGRG